MTNEDFLRAKRIRQDLDAIAKAKESMAAGDSVKVGERLWELLKDDLGVWLDDRKEVLEAEFAAL